MSDTASLLIYSPILVIFFILNETFYETQLAWANLVCPIYTLDLQVFHYFISFYGKITLLNIKSPIAVHTHIFFLSTILQRNPCVP